MSTPEKAAIVYIKLKQGQLQFKDNEGDGWSSDITTQVYAGGTISFRANDKGSDLSDIADIAGLDSVIDGDFTKSDQNKVWDATIKTGIKGTFNYTITCDDVSHDPELEVVPPPGA